MNKNQLFRLIIISLIVIMVILTAIKFLKSPAPKLRIDPATTNTLTTDKSTRSTSNHLTETSTSSSLTPDLVSLVLVEETTEYYRFNLVNQTDNYYSRNHGSEPDAFYLDDDTWLHVDTYFSFAGTPKTRSAIGWSQNLGPKAALDYMLSKEDVPPNKTCKIEFELEDQNGDSVTVSHVFIEKK